MTSFADEDGTSLSIESTIVTLSKEWPFEVSSTVVGVWERGIRRLQGHGQRHARHGTC